MLQTEKTLYAHTLTLQNAGGGVYHTSDAIDLKGNTATLFLTPATWTTAELDFLVSFDNTTFYPLYENTGQYKIASTVMAALEVYSLPADVFKGIRYLKVRSGAASAEVDQGSAKTFKIYATPVLDD